MNQYERNFRQDSIASAALLLAGLAWIVLAAVQATPAGSADALVARAAATPHHAASAATAAPHLEAGSRSDASPS